MAQLEQNFENTLFKLIPQTKNLGMKIDRIEDHQITVHGDYALNKNHLDIVFGGSIAAISITTAWSLVQHKVEQAGLKGNLVIKRQEIDYLLPVKTDFECKANFQSADDWDNFVNTYRDKGRAKIIVTAQILSESKITSKFQGVFVLYQ
ncbi:thioesterase domain-containing protein, putative [Methylophilus rhizosphaerae]|uniref:Thioesterase domain-containing protein, putative n=1 Tax=Methylophilus rhizosphaerae TaxID=492660 RepID=A0A1G9E9A6_9PROT|nr:YiiD C-terminal domain-containing protein [Methylophilus rhizosphaerae]SDK72733.1 thioesterase domain-containing protein, putative [Methylophilus rhizosphaerae]